LTSNWHIWERWVLRILICQITKSFVRVTVIVHWINRLINSCFFLTKANFCVWKSQAKFKCSRFKEDNEILWQIWYSKLMFRRLVY
jgi:hypothetical protein